MGAVGEESFESFLRFGNRIRLCDAYSIEAARASLLSEASLDRGRFGQKSRLA
jgi:hypothetical protein